MFISIRNFILISSFLILLSSAAPYPSFRGSELSTTTTTSSSSSSSSSVIDYSSWMSLYSSRRLQDLVIPGSHDAAAYKTEDNLPLFINRWVLTQELSILDQLEAGIRFLDIRLTYRNNELWTAHRFHTISFKQVSDDVMTFITNHPTEIVIIKLQADSHIDDTIRTLFDQSGEDAKRIIQPFLEDLTSVAVPPLMARSSIKDLTSRGMNVVLLEGEGRSIPRGGKLWPWTLMSTKWHNAQFGATLCQRLVENTEWARDNTLNIYQVQITPSSETILQGSGVLVFGDLKGAAQNVEQTVLLPFLETLDGSFSGIIGHDFVGDEKVISEIISVNSRPVKARTNLLEDAINAKKICSNGSCFDDDDCKGLTNKKCDTNIGTSRYTCIAQQNINPFSPNIPAPAPFFRNFRFGF